MEPQLHSEHVKLFNEAKEEVFLHVNAIFQKLLTNVLVIYCAEAQKEEPSDDIDEISDEPLNLSTFAPGPREIMPTSEDCPPPPPSDAVIDDKSTNEIASQRQQLTVAVQNTLPLPAPSLCSINNNTQIDNQNCASSSAVAATSSTVPNEPIIPLQLALGVKEEIDGQLVRRIEIGDRYDDLVDVYKEPCHCSDVCLAQLYYSSERNVVVNHENAPQFDCSEQDYYQNNTTETTQQSSVTTAGNVTVNYLEPALDEPALPVPPGVCQTPDPQPPVHPLVERNGEIRQNEIQNESVPLTESSNVVYTTDPTIIPLAPLLNQQIKQPNDDETNEQTRPTPSAIVAKPKESQISESQKATGNATELKEQQTIKRKTPADADETSSKAKTKPQPQKKKKRRLEEGELCSDSDESTTTDCRSTSDPQLLTRTISCSSGSGNKASKSKNVSTASKSTTSNPSSSTNRVIHSSSAAKNNNSKQPKQSTRESSDKDKGGERTSRQTSNRKRANERSAAAKKLLKDKLLKEKSSTLEESSRSEPRTSAKRSERTRRSPSSKDPAGPQAQPQAHARLEKFKLIYCYCGVCNGKFEGLDPLRRHEYDKHHLKAYRCAYIYCSESFHKMADLSNHRNKYHHGVKEWKCKYCRAIFGTQTSLKQHYFFEHERGIFRCTFAECDYSASYRVDSLNHYKREHGNNSNSGIVNASISSVSSTTTATGKSTAVCDITNSTNSVTALSSSTIAATDACNAIASTTPTLTTLTVAEMDKYTIELVKCLVPDCHRYFTLPNEMEEHLMKVHARKAIGCIFAGCLASFAEVSHMTQHVVMVHPCAKYWCYTTRECDFGTADPAEMYLHQYCFHQEGRFKCNAPRCEFEDKQRGIVVRHFDRAHRPSSLIG